MASSFVKVQGTDLTVDGERLVLRGFGLGTWMNMEHFMTGLPGTDHKKRLLFEEVYGRETAGVIFDTFLAEFVTEADIGYLKSLGVNCLRLPFTYRHFEDDQSPGEFSAEGFRHLDRVIDLCARHEIYAVLDLHAVPGGQNPDSHADTDLGHALFWDDASFRRRVVDLWVFIAAHYKDETWVVAYDVVNEPVFVPNDWVLQEFFEQTVAAIRSVDQNHIIFLEGDHWAQDFSKLSEPSDEQIAYSIHYYPGMSIDKNDRITPVRDAVEKSLTPLFRVRERFQRPLWCGETGALYTKAGMETSLDLVKATLDVLEEHGVSWTLWTYKDAQAMGLVYPEDESHWMKLVRSTGWDHHSEMAHAAQIFDFAEKTLGFPPLPENLRYRSQFRLRGWLHSLYLEQVLKPLLHKTPAADMLKAVKSFRFEQCGLHEEIERLVRSYSGAGGNMRKTV